MEVIGLCSVCSKPARFTCGLCGQLFCPEHYDRSSGLCHRCSPDLRPTEKHDGPPRDRLLQ